MDIRVNTDKVLIDREEILELRPRAGEALDRLWSGREEMTGWVQAPLHLHEPEIEEILNAADVVREEAELFLVLGIGGSYLGAKAAIDALPKAERGIPVRFFGTGFCADDYLETMELVKEKKTILCVISKSGRTTEIKAAFETIKPLMAEKYGSERDAARRIIAITDPREGDLRKEAEEKGYTTFDIPPDIGGRYSVFTPAGLLPMAVSGIDIRELIRGAVEMSSSPDWDKDGTDYAIIRELLRRKGCHIEALEMCHSRLEFLGQWIRQLYGESEGKEGKGLFPSVMMLSRDLHSMGQYLQQGPGGIFETMIMVDEPYRDTVIPAGDLQGRSICEMNRIMADAVTEAHGESGISVVRINLPELTPRYYGQLLYFLETTCAITAMLEGVNPFNQPGVEAYKAEMRKLLKK
ncbi:MAG: glucose-6-phosphate isomerase [Clostridiales bacterium]|nr:glucose-6-phosphate isomerase [Clostridiales bacterium]MDD7035154.1 glucose-6-phosphate isomerase [Bacillota bacterium]MDY2920060.1 glucose-6-phosphate isomerase [Lentihominibacter sp.]